MNDRCITGALTHENGSDFFDDPLWIYLAEVKKVLPLNPEEEIECIRHICAVDEWAESAGKRLLEANLQLVVTIAERFPHQQLHILDLIQAGNSGLLTAIQTIRDHPADNFPGYATPFIESAIAVLALFVPEVPS